MKKKTIYIITIFTLIALYVTSCGSGKNGLVYDQSKDIVNLEKIDQSLLELAKDGGYYYFSDWINNKFVRIIKVNDEILFTQTLEGSYFSESKIFDVDTHQIIGEGKSFLRDNKVGVWKFYDKKGSLAEIADYDQSFLFTPNDVLKYCEAHGITVPFVYESSGVYTNISSLFVDEKPLWEIIYDKEDVNTLVIMLDGKSGKIVEFKFYIFDEPEFY